MVLMRPGRAQGQELIPTDKFNDLVWSFTERQKTSIPISCDLLHMKLTPAAYFVDQQETLKS